MLSALAKSFYADSPLLAYPIIALLLFLVTFTAITWRVLRTPRSELDALAQLPFQDDPATTEREPPRRAGDSKKPNRNEVLDW